MSNSILTKTLKINLSNKQLLTCSNINEFIDNLLPSPEHLITNHNYAFTKIKFIRANYQFYNDMHTKKQLFDYLSMKTKSKEFNDEKFKFLVDICKID